MKRASGGERKIVRERQNAIIELLHKAGSVVVVDLAEQLSASRETIRRDLTLLAEQGLLRKVHGGAVQLQSATEDPFQKRMAQNIDAKRRIGRKAAALFNAGDSLMIDAGSTTVCFAEALALSPGKTIITNSQLVAQAASGSDRGNRVFLLGGEYDAEGGECLGVLTNDQIRLFQVDHAVLTVGAVGSTGEFMDFIADAAFTARSMIARARSVTILVDSSKFERFALFQLCSPSEISRVVTDAPPPAPTLRAFEQAGVEVILAEK